MDYASLRQEGIRQLERLAGDQWTDFNAHDPGITILEQLCYALSDLGYRAEYDIPDLLAEGKSEETYKDLHSPAAILTCRPVTQNDLRRLILDVDGVKNAWIEVITQTSPALYYHPDRQELSLNEKPAPSEPVSLLGLYRVLVEPVDATSNVTAQVAKRLHANRGLCEDFDEIVQLDAQPIQVKVTIEIGQVDDIEAAGLDIEQRIADEISPPVPFTSLDELVRAGRSADEIFTGPRLKHGFLTDEALQRATRRTAVNTSDLIHAIMDAPNVRAVSEIRLGTGNKSDPNDKSKIEERWSLPVDPKRVARLDRAYSTIVLTREGKSYDRVDSSQKKAQTTTLTVSTAAADLTQPLGRNRNVSQYWSVQNHFPALYGVGELGLPSSASPERQAQAKQLKAYLTIFDQLMANYLAQLAHVKDLFAYDGDQPRTYFTQPLAQPGLGFEELFALSNPPVPDANAKLEAGSYDRKSRFLSHLLARFAETVDEHVGLAKEALAQNRQAFLRHYPRLSGARGAAVNYLLPEGDANRSGLAERLRLKLGLQPGLVREDDETFILVEHILLRPISGDSGDVLTMDPDDDQQQLPLLSAAIHEDPYSLQLTFVFPGEVGRFGQSDFRPLIEQTIRKETPAHLTPYVKWLTKAEFKVFQDTYNQWIARQRNYAAGKLSLKLEELSS